MAKTAERISEQSSADNPILQRHIIAYRAAGSSVTGKVLEVGCGEGYGIKYLAPLADYYVAIDKFHSPIFDEYQGRKWLEFHQMNVPPFEDLEDESFDAVVSFQVIEHIKDDELFLDEIKRVLKKGGKAILTTPNKKMSLTRNPWHIREYAPKEIDNLLSRYFDQYQIKGVYGNSKVMKYYEENKKAVERITRFDILNLQYRLPRFFLKIPYDILNRINRENLKKKDSELAAQIKAEDYYLDEVSDHCLDYFIELEKS